MKNNSFLKDFAIFYSFCGIGTYLSSLTSLWKDECPGTTMQKQTFSIREGLAWPAFLFTGRQIERYFKYIGLHRNDYNEYLHKRINW